MSRCASFQTCTKIPVLEQFSGPLRLVLGASGEIATRHSKWPRQQKILIASQKERHTYCNRRYWLRSSSKPILTLVHNTPTSANYIPNSIIIIEYASSSRLAHNSDKPKSDHLYIIFPSIHSDHFYLQSIHNNARNARPLGTHSPKQAIGVTRDMVLPALT